MLIIHVTCTVTFHAAFNHSYYLFHSCCFYVAIMLPLQFMFYFIFSFFHSLHTFYAYATLFSIDMEITAISQKLTDHVRAYSQKAYLVYLLGWQVFIKICAKKWYITKMYTEMLLLKKICGPFQMLFQNHHVFPLQGESHKNVIVPLQEESHKKVVVPLQGESHKNVVVPLQGESHKKVAP